MSVSYTHLDVYKRQVIDNRNGVRYLVLTQQAESMGITVTITQFAYIKNGMMYFFQFSGWPGDEGYDDFLTMIDSARSVSYTHLTLRPRARRDRAAAARRWRRSSARRCGGWKTA